MLGQEGSLRRRPRFVCKEGAALDRAYGRPVRYFPLPRTAADICVRTVRKGPAIRFQVIAADGPSRTIHCVRLPSTAGNWRSRWTQGTISCADNADGADGLAPPSSGALVIRRRECRPWPRSQPSFDKLLHLPLMCNSANEREGYFHGKLAASQEGSNLSKM